jgi:hypothetical protein
MTGHPPAGERPRHLNAPTIGIPVACRRVVGLMATLTRSWRWVGSDLEPGPVAVISAGLSLDISRVAVIGEACT